MRILGTENADALIVDANSNRLKVAKTTHVLLISILHVIALHTSQPTVGGSMLFQIHLLRRESNLRSSWVLA
jgi:hypothetical protein